MNVAKELTKEIEKKAKIIAKLQAKYNRGMKRAQIISSRLMEMRKEKAEADLKKGMSLPDGYLLLDPKRNCGNCYLRDHEICTYDMSAMPNFDSEWPTYLDWRKGHTIDIGLGLCNKHKYKT